MLGFYVYLVVKRWWEQYCKLPWPDTMAFFLRGLVVEGDEEVTRLVRRTVIRYCLLAYILCIRKFSDRLRRRFPGIMELVRTGIIRLDEAEESHPNKSLITFRYIVPTYKLNFKPTFCKGLMKTQNITDLMA